MKERRKTSFRLTIILKVRIERQYEESMFSVRILVSGMTKRIVLQAISGKTFLLEARFCSWKHRTSRR